MSLPQNQKFSQTETVTRILCAYAQGKTRWQPAAAELMLLLLTGMIWIEREIACYFDEMTDDFFFDDAFSSFLSVSILFTKLLVP